METPHQRSWLQRLPPDVQHQVARLLPDPADLATACSSAAALLDQDALLLDWAQAWMARLTASVPSSQHRHPGYALLLWPRLRCMDTPRLASLLLQWAARQSPSEPPISLGGGSIANAQQCLDAGDALGALHALLPHSQHLLLLYAAQAGNMQLLGDLLQQLLEAWEADPGQLVVKLQWDEETAVTQLDLLLPAALAAARGGRVDAMQALLAAMQATGWGRHTDSALEDWQQGMGLTQRDAVHLDLLDAAVRGGARSAACALALLGMWQGPPLAGVAGALLLPAAAAGGDEAVVRALLAAGLKPQMLQDGDEIEAADGLALRPFDSALWHGHLHLLPRLWTLDQLTRARHICSVVGMDEAGWIRRNDAPQLALIPQAMWDVRDEEDASFIWELGLNSAVRVGSLATLQAVWATFGADDTAAVDHRARMGCVMVAVLANGPHSPCPDTLQWLLEVVLPELRASGQWEEQQMRDTEEQALARGHAGLLLALQPPETTAAFVLQHPAWQEAELRANVISCVRRGDVAGVQAALEALDEFGPVEDFMEPDHHVNMRRQLFAQVLDCAAALADGDAAEAIVRVVAPHISNGSLDVSFLRAHQGRLLTALFDTSPIYQLMWTGASATSAIGRWDFRRACPVGNAHTLAALVSHERQKPSYLSEHLAWTPVSHVSGTVIQDPHVPMHNITGLLHLLAAQRFEGDGAGVQGSGHFGRAGDAGGGAAGQAAGLGAAVGGGGDGAGEGSGVNKPLPPAGARVLSEWLLGGVLRSGVPDLLHALLVYMDCWGPLGTLAGTQQD